MNSHNKVKSQASARGLWATSLVALTVFVGFSFAQDAKPAVKPANAAAKATPVAKTVAPAASDPKSVGNLKGPAGAPIKVVEYADFMCPGCRAASQALHSYYSQQGPDINLTFKNFPLDQNCNPGIGRSVHNGACELALGSICAADLGMFWPYHDRIFSRAWEVATRQDAVDNAVAVGLNKTKFEACLDSTDAKSKLALQVKEGFEVVVQVTPTILINGKKLSALNQFAAVIDEERKKVAAPTK